MPLHYGKEIVGIYGGDARPSADIPLIVNALSSSNLSNELLYSEFNLENINEGIEGIRSGDLVGRAILRLNS
jgi:Zn-dependent alcohol dehydrogenase